MRRYSPLRPSLCTMHRDGRSPRPRKPRPAWVSGPTAARENAWKAATRRDRGLGYAHRQGVAQRLTSTDENTEQTREKSSPKRQRSRRFEDTAHLQNHPHPHARLEHIQRMKTYRQSPVLGGA